MELSANFIGHNIFNDFWAKGSYLVNNLFGVLIRFNEKIGGALKGDKRKMYHDIVKTKP